MRRASTLEFNHDESSDLNIYFEIFRDSNELVHEDRFLHLGIFHAAVFPDRGVVAFKPLGYFVNEQDTGYCH